MTNLLRASKILRVALRYRLDRLLPPQAVPTALRAVIAPLKLLPTPAHSPAQALRLALIELGPIFIKFGQLLSTRRDLLNDELIDELAKLQDQVPPFDEAEAAALIEASLGKPLQELFASFDNTPLASASIAQVHAAHLKDGSSVVVKIVRPGIEATIRQDTDLMMSLAKRLAKYSADGRRLKPEEVVSDYRHTIFDELDLQREGANTSQLRRNFQGSEILYVPEIYWDYSSENVLTMERIDGIPVTDIAALNAQGTDFKKLAERGVEIFFTQVFRDSFFHADMHPGNIFVAKTQPESPQYIAIDCAIIGSLSDADQYYLARNLLAIFQRDYAQVAKLHIECGWVPAHTHSKDFEAAIRTVCEPIFEKPLGEISFAQLLIKLFQTARRFDMEVQPSLVLLQKTLLHIEGLGRELYPQLDLWQTAKPFLEQWLKDRYSPSGLFQRFKQDIPEILELLPQLPELMAKQTRQQPPANKIKPPRKQRGRQALALLLACSGLLCIIPEWRAILQQLPTESYLLGLAAVYLWYSS